MKRFFRILSIALLCGALSAPAISAQRHGGNNGSRERTTHSGGTNRGNSGSRNNNSSRPSHNNTGRPNNGSTGRPGIGNNKPSNTHKPSGTPSWGNNNGNSHKPSGTPNVGNNNNKPNNGNRPGIGNNNGNNNHKPNGNRPNIGNGNNKPNGNHPSTGRPGIGNNKPNNNHKPNTTPNWGNNRPDHRPNVGNRPNPGNRPNNGFGPSHGTHRPGVSAPVHRPSHLAPPPHPYRPNMYRPHYRPTPPPRWRPARGIPAIHGILGLTFGTAINLSLDFLYNSGYVVDGYSNDVVYLRNVNQLNYIWTDAALYYGSNGLDASSFYYATPYYDMTRYNAVYNNLVALYGQPVSINSAGQLGATWFGGNQGYITLSFGANNVSGGALRYLTTLTFGL